MMTARFLRPLFAAAALAATLTGAAAHAQQAAATAAQTAPAAAQPILNIGQIHDKLQAASTKSRRATRRASPSSST